jgi:hypothetical protein
MVATLPLIYVLEEMEPFPWVDATLVDAGDATLVEIVVDDRVRAGPALDLPSQDFIVWEFSIGEVGDKGLRPG